SLFVATGHLHGLVHQRDWYRSGARDGDGRPTHRVRAAALPDSVAADVATAAQDGAFRTHGALNSGTKCAVLPLGAPRRSILKTAAFDRSATPSDAVMMGPSVQGDRARATVDREMTAMMPRRER